MSGLLPNINDLLAALPANAQAADARELSIAATTAGTVDEIDQALLRVVDGWLRDDS